jgi:cytochrome c peroxidase
VAAGQEGRAHLRRTGRLQAVQGQWLHRLSQRPGRGRQLLPEDGHRAAYKATSPAEGRSAVTGKEIDRFNFKVPTLRNVDMTYPYFHDGAANTLTEAVDIMGRLQLGKKFTNDENAKVVAFLKTLTGDQPSFMMPILPPSSDKTPRPNPFK